MKPVLRISFKEYSDLEKMFGQHIQYVEVPGTKENTKFMAINLAEVVLVPCGWSDEHIKNYGEPVREI